MKKTNLFQSLIGKLLIFCMVFSIGFSSQNIRSFSATKLYPMYVKTATIAVKANANTKSKTIGSWTQWKKVFCYSTSGSWTKVKFGSKNGYVPTKALSKTYLQYVATDTLNVRKSASSSSALLGTLKRGTCVVCYENSNSWTKISFASGYAYVATKYLANSKKAAPTTTEAPTTQVPGTTETPTIDSTEVNKKATGQEIADYAKKFVGSPFKMGGTDLKTGTDASGFTLAIYKHFGYDIVHGSIAQRNVGKKISLGKRSAGDLICYQTVTDKKTKESYSLVGIYLGSNKVIYSGNKEKGVQISKWNFLPVQCVRRVVTTK